MASTDIENQNLPLKGWHGLLQMMDPGTTGQFASLNTIGWVASVSLDIGNSTDSYFAIGDRVAKQTSRGQVELSGTIGRAFVDSSLIRLMFGQTDGTAVIDLSSASITTNPITMMLQVRDTSVGTERVVQITLTEVILEGFSIEYSSDENIMENVDYQAGDIRIVWDAAILGQGFEWSDGGSSFPVGTYGPNLDDLTID